MFIPDPGSWFLSIPDPGSKNSKLRGVKLFYFWNAEEKNLGKFWRKYRTFYPKIVTRLSKICVWDPGSEIREKPIPDPGSRGQKGTRYRIPDSDPRDPGKTHSGSRIKWSKRHQIPDPGSGSATLVERWDIVEWLERLSANAKVATVLDSILPKLF